MSLCKRAIWRRSCCPFHFYELIPKPETIYYGKYCYNGEYYMTYEELVCDANNLYKAYKASIKGSKWKDGVS